MSTNRSFQAMLNQYLPLDLLKQEFIKRDYLMQKVDHIESWKGGELIIPFTGQIATSIEFGQLAAQSDISQHKYVRGSISVQPETWSSLSFAHRDLMEHDGRIPESTFLKILPDQIESMMMYYKMVVSTHLLGGPHFDRAVGNGTVGGVLPVARIDRYNKDQKIVLQDNDTAAATYYVIDVSVYDESITVSATRGGGAADISAYSLAAATKVYHPGALTGAMTSLPSQMLSLANGGTANLFGQAKTDHQFLQCPNLDGSTISASNILEKIFDGYVQRMKLAKGGKAPEVLMSFKHFGSCLKLLESQKGPFNVVPNSRKVGVYGWDTIEIGSVSGQTITLVGIQEADDSHILYLDWSSVKFYSNGLFKRRKAPDGKEYYEVRETTGYFYILDHCLYGDLVLTAPWKNAILTNIPNY